MLNATMKMCVLHPDTLFQDFPRGPDYYCYYDSMYMNYVCGYVCRMALHLYSELG